MLVKSCLQVMVELVKVRLVTVEGWERVEAMALMVSRLFLVSLLPLAGWSRNHCALSMLESTLWHFVLLLVLLLCALSMLESTLWHFLWLPLFLLSAMMGKGALVVRVIGGKNQMVATAN